MENQKQKLQLCTDYSQEDVQTARIQITEWDIVKTTYEWLKFLHSDNFAYKTFERSSFSPKVSEETRLTFSSNNLQISMWDG